MEATRIPRARCFRIRFDAGNEKRNRRCIGRARSKEDRGNEDVLVTEDRGEPEGSKRSFDTGFLTNKATEGLERDVSSTERERSSRIEAGALNWTRPWKRKIVSTLSSLKAAILDLSAIASLSAIGTVIEQGKSLEFYQEFYPDGKEKVLGFVTWKLILFLGLDHVYTSPLFYGTVVYLALSLVACTSTTQLPLLKRAKTWSFLDVDEIQDLPHAEDLPDGKVADLGRLLHGNGYQIFLKDGRLYAFKGLAGRYAPIWVHVSLLLIMLGGSCSALGGLRGDLIVPEEQGVVIAQGLRPLGPFPWYPSGASYGLYVDNFDIKYRPSGKVEQFFSTLSVIDDDGDVLLTKRISVNDPLRWRGVAMYQTDWSIAAVEVSVKQATDDAGGTILRLPFATLQDGETGVGGRIWATLLPIGSSGEKKGISILARDLQSVALYSSDGAFVGVRRPGSTNSIEVDGLELVVDRLIGSTGLEFRSDPGVPVVYAGFGMLMCTTVVSCFSHAQVWAVQEKNNLRVGGKANRGMVDFIRELDGILDSVP